MANLEISLQILWMCVCFAFASRVVSGEDSNNKGVQPTMKSFADILKEKMDKVEEIKSELQEKRNRNNGFAVSLFGELTNEVYNFRQGFGNNENKMIETYAGHAYEADVNRNSTQHCFNFIKHIAKSGRKSLDNNEACFNRALLFGLAYLKNVESVIKHALKVIDHGIEAYLHQYEISKDFSTVTDLETYLQAEQSTTAILKSAIEIEFKTIPQITLMWSKFQRWYDNKFRSGDIYACTKSDSYVNVQNFFLVSHGYTMCCLTRDNKFCIPQNAHQ